MFEEASIIRNGLRTECILADDICRNSRIEEQTFFTSRSHTRAAGRQQSGSDALRNNYGEKRNAVDECQATTRSSARAIPNLHGDADVVLAAPGGAGEDVLGARARLHLLRKATLDAGVAGSSPRRIVAFRLWQYK